MDVELSAKSRLASVVLCLLPAFFTIGGIHRLYLGKALTGLAMLALTFLGWASHLIAASLDGNYALLVIRNVFFGALIIWSLADVIWIILGNMRDGYGHLVRNW